MAEQTGVRITLASNFLPFRTGGLSSPSSCHTLNRAILRYLYENKVYVHALDINIDYTAIPDTTLGKNSTEMSLQGDISILACHL